MAESIEKSFYKIKEVSEMLDIPASTLRFWESQFTQLKPKRNAGGTRFYRPADVEMLKMIKFLIKDKGLKIGAAQEELRHNHKGVSQKQRALETLRAVRDELEGIVQALHKFR